MRGGGVEAAFEWVEREDRTIKREEEACCAPYLTQILLLHACSFSGCSGKSLVLENTPSFPYLTFPGFFFWSLWCSKVGGRRLKEPIGSLLNFPPFFALLCLCFFLRGYFLSAGPSFSLELWKWTGSWVGKMYNTPTRTLVTLLRWLSTTTC